MSFGWRLPWTGFVIQLISFNVWHHDKFGFFESRNLSKFRDPRLEGCIFQTRTCVLSRRCPGPCFLISRLPRQLDAIGDATVALPPDCHYTIIRPNIKVEAPTGRIRHTPGATGTFLFIQGSMCIPRHGPGEEFYINAALQWQPSFRGNCHVRSMFRQSRRTYRS